MSAALTAWKSQPLDSQKWRDNGDDGKDAICMLELCDVGPNSRQRLNEPSRTQKNITHTNNQTFCLIKPNPCVEKVSLLLLLSRNTVWVLTQILKYLRAASLSCFAVKWLPLHQWNNNWYDNRFIWASSSLRCYFVEGIVKAMAASRHFWFVCVSVGDKARLGTKNDLYHLTIN